MRLKSFPGHPSPPSPYYLSGSGNGGKKEGRRQPNQRVVHGNFAEIYYQNQTEHIVHHVLPEHVMHMSYNA